MQPDRSSASGSLLLMNATSARPARRADAARNRAALLHTARQHLRAGDGSLRMHAIARDAGVGIGTAYRHFPTREALLEALTAESLARLVGRAREAATDPDLGRGLQDALCAMLDGARDPALAEVLAPGHAAGPATAALLVRLKAALGMLLDGARAGGLVRPNVTDDDLHRLLCGLQLALDLGQNRAGLTELYAEILLAGLRPAPA